MKKTRLRKLLHPGLVPIVGLLFIWWLVAATSNIPTYLLPPPNEVVSTALELASSGELFDASVASVSRLVLSFVIGASLGLVVGLAISMNRWVASFLEAPVIFFQAIAGIAWVPLAIVWFGLGAGPVIFVVANAIFFIILYNTILGVQSISPRLREAALTLGAGRWGVLKEVILPGALANILVGLRTGLAFGWRALVAAELIAANAGLGYIALEASSRFDSATVIVAIVVVGCIWLVIDKLFLSPIERRTVERWGLVRRTGS